MKWLLIVFIALYCVSCVSEPSTTQESTPEKTANTEKALNEKPDMREEKDTVDNRINNNNVKERLLAYGKENKETIVKIYTTKGPITIRLYKDTPLHRANFLLLAKSGYFTKAVFNRVRKDFIAQTGGTYSEEQAALKGRIGNYTVPAEINKNHFHKAGAVGAARSYEDNPDKRSHAAQFYFIEGSRFNEETLGKYENENNYMYPASHKAYYLENEGAAHLDGQHTVFGEIIAGFDVVPKLTSVATSTNDRPYEDLYIDSAVVIR